MVTTRLPKTIVKPTALGPVANTDTKLLIYGLFQKGRVLAQDGLESRNSAAVNPTPPLWHLDTRVGARAHIDSAVTALSAVGPASRHREGSRARKRNAMEPGQRVTAHQRTS